MLVNTVNYRMELDGDFDYLKISRGIFQNAEAISNVLGKD